MTIAARLTVERAPLIPAGARCIAYVRVSTERQAGETKVSPETQLARCKALATERGLSVDHVIEDHESGAHLERLDRLVEVCKTHRLTSGQRGLIVVYDTSRWGRFERPGVDRMFREQLWRLGWDVRIGDEPETDHEAANLFVSTGQAIAASEYRRQLRQKVVDNMPKIAKQGFWQGRAPFGYSITEVDERHKLVKGSERDVATVRRIFSRFAAGATLQAIAAQLNEDKAPGPFDQHPSHTWDWSKATTQHPNGRRPPCGKWTGSAVRSLLVNETYTGRIVFKPREVRDERGRPLRFKRGHVPEEHWVIVEDAHPALVERSQFEAARQRLNDRRKPRHWSKSKQPFFLSGLLTCASCGGQVIGGGGSKYTAKDPDATRFYRCRNGNLEEPTCTNPALTVNQRWLEREVLTRVSDHVQRLIESGKLAKLLDERMRADDGGKLQDRLGRELQGLEAQRRTVVEKIAKGLITDDDAAETMAGIKTRLAAVGRELENVKSRPSRSDRQAERDRLLKMAADFPALIKRVPAPVARELLSYWLEGVTLDKKGRIGTMRLRQVPGLSNATPARRARGRRCWRADSPPRCRG